LSAPAAKLATALTEDQVTPMFYRSNIVSAQTLVKVASAVLLLLVGGLGMAQVANSGVAPVLVPYTINAIAGNFANNAAGFGGDGGPGTSATLSTPNSVAVDTAGNVYISDNANALIRELNAQTGLITIVAGIPPSSCSGVKCTVITTGCPEGVPAIGNPTSKVRGLVVDGSGNLYFSDSTNQGVWVIYRSGARVAAFINLVDPTGVTTAGGVKPGYVYHVAGTATYNAGVCSSSKFVVGTTTKAQADNVIATQGLLFNPGQIGLDGAGNLYIQDVSNDVVRVVNTQATPQTFFGVSVPPGYINSIVGCNSILTSACPTTTTFGVSAAQALFSTALDGMYVDKYGNVYEMNTSPASPIYAGVAFAGGPGNTALANLLTLEAKPGITVSAGDWYSVFGNQGGANNDPQAELANGNASPILRPASITVDPYGNVYAYDYHYAAIYRVDVNSQVATLVTYVHTPGNGTVATPAYCIAANKSGPQDYDAYGDGCPVVNGKVQGGTQSYIDFDGAGNLYIVDQTNNIVRKVTVNTQFPATAIGTPIQQTIQIHFDGANSGTLPVISTAVVPYTTTAFSLLPGITDFQIVGVPTCANYTLGIDKSLECYVVVSFTPGAAGARSATLQTVTANGSTYTWGLTGTGTGTQLLIDGGQQTVITGAVSSIPVTSYSVANNVVSITAANTFTVGQLVSFSGLTSATFLNGLSLPVLSTGLSTTQFQVQISASPALTVPVTTEVGMTGFGPSAVAIGPGGNLYVADPANNQILIESTAGTVISKITASGGVNFLNPVGVAVDAAKNVYISDTGNNRVVEINAVTSVQTTLLPLSPTSLPSANLQSPAIMLKSPQGLAVDLQGNVYVADTGGTSGTASTGGGRIVEISPSGELGAVSLLENGQGTSPLINPVAVAVDVKGNIYVADTGIPQIVKIPAGGGDLITPAGKVAMVGKNLTAPTGVAVDGGGNLYVSDLTSVYEIPAGSGPGNEQFALGFTGLAKAGGLALDPLGNVYLTDFGGRILEENRSNLNIAFGVYPELLPPLASTLKVTNVGTQPIAIATPFFTATDPGDFPTSAGCSNSPTLLAGLHCDLTVSFAPQHVGPLTSSVAVQGGLTVSLTGTGIPPQPLIILTAAAPGGLIAAQTATVTATLTQPYIATGAPTGTVTFNYTINGIPGPASTVTLVPGAAGATVASIQLPAFLLGRLDIVTAVYNGDVNDSPITATPLQIYVPGRPVTVVSSSQTFVYGAAVPALTGTVTGILASDAATVTYKFVTAATPSTPVGVYPIKVVFAGGNYQDYGYPPALTTSGAPAVVTETPAPLKATVANSTSPYGGVNVSFSTTLVGLANGDLFSEAYTPGVSSILPVGTYQVSAALSGVTKTSLLTNYTLTVVPGTLTITKGTTTVVPSTTATVTAPSTIPTPFPTTLSSVTITLTAKSAVPTGQGYPTGTVTVTSIFTPVQVGQSLPLAPVTIGTYPLTYVPCSSANCTPTSVATFTPTNAALGQDCYSVTYSGDSNFTGSTSLSPQCILVDNSDFNLTAATDPLLVIPGVIPGGNAAILGEQASTPETTTISVVPINGITGTVQLSCAAYIPGTAATPTALATLGVPAPYLTCTLTPNLVVFPAGSTTTLTSVLAVQTAATLPINSPYGSIYGALRQSPTQTILALLPLGVLAFLPWFGRGRRKLGKALWILLTIGAMGLGITGCGPNSVKFYTPVPAGPLSVVITATGMSNTNGAMLTRTVTVPLNVQ
jgi:sugar lactone lactonase YvrE